MRKLSETFQSYREAINPPYSKDTFAIVVTLFILFAIPISVFATYNSRSLFSNAAGGNSSSTTRAPSAEGAVSGEAAGTPIVNCTVDPAVDSEEQNFLTLINQHRANNGRSPLRISPTLTRASAWKAKDVADNNYFAHDDLPLGRTWSQRLRDCGYTYNAYTGENLAGGSPYAIDSFNQWLFSPGHNANMLGDNYTVIGVGRAVSASGYWYWATDFGSFDDSAPTGCMRQSPEVFISPQVIISDVGKSETYTVTVSNMDSASCGSSTFNLSEVLPAGMTSTFANPNLTLDPATAAETVLTVNVGSTAIDGVKILKTTVRNSASPTISGTANSKLVVAIGSGVDSDKDGFSDSREIYLGTDPADKCPDNLTDKAYPVDFNNDTVVRTKDITAIVNNYYKENQFPGWQRYDLDGDGHLRVGDVVVTNQFYFIDCTN